MKSGFQQKGSKPEEDQWQEGKRMEKITEIQEKILNAAIAEFAEKGLSHVRQSFLAVSS